MKEVNAGIEIAAPIGQVWNVLSDFGSYPEWNPFIIRLVGEAKSGSVLRATTRSPGRKEMSFNTELAGYDERHRILLKSTYLPVLLHGQHAFFVEQIDESHTRFFQSVAFSGPIRPLVGGSIRDAQKGLEQMNEAMKARCEKVKGA